MFDTLHNWALLAGEVLTLSSSSSSEMSWQWDDPDYLERPRIPERSKPCKNTCLANDFVSLDLHCEFYQLTTYSHSRTQRNNKYGNVFIALSKAHAKLNILNTFGQFVETKLVSTLCCYRYSKFLLYLGVPPQDIAKTKASEFLKVIAEFALEYRTTRDRVLQQLEKRANHRERNKTRGKMIIDVSFTLYHRLTTDTGLFYLITWGYCFSDYMFICDLLPSTLDHYQIAKYR